MTLLKAMRMPLRVFFISIFVLFILGCGGYATIAVWPSIGAQAAEILRVFAGDQAVAWLEGTVFQTQDTIQQWEYALGNKPLSPWNTTPPASERQLTSPTKNISPAPVIPTTPLPAYSTATPQPTLAFSPTPAEEPDRFPPAAIPSMGTLAGEGIWLPYFSNAEGQTVAYRTFLQPDPSRPYSIAALVAIDLSRTRLHYVIGFDEPESRVPLLRTGRIPADDFAAGVLLAAFNGGFLTRHGYYGVIVDGTTLEPMRTGLGTLAVSGDNRVQIGVWGKDIVSSDTMRFLRQNGPIIIENGQINPQTNTNSIEDWGATIQGEVATWRSAVGINEDGNTLYYLAGWNLTIAPLARALKAADVYSAIQLDINEYWVLFSTIHFSAGKPTAAPLFKEMEDNNDRYLRASQRDFFYITAAGEK